MPKRKNSHNRLNGLKGGCPRLSSAAAENAAEYRTKFLEEMIDIERRMLKFKGDDMLFLKEFNLRQGEKRIVFISHDESTFYCNEGKALIWMRNGKTRILPKSKGQSIMVSGFICDCHGFISDADVRGGVSESFQFFEAGINRDGRFNNADLVNQTEKVIPLVERIHPDCELVFAFDNSLNHHARAPDGLDASLLNLSDGGAYRRTIKDGWYEVDGERRVHKMHTDAGPQKGIKTILTERNKHLNSKNLPLLLECQACKNKITAECRAEKLADGTMDTRCCARYTLSQEPDFVEQEEWLTETVKKTGHRIIFFPKFHPKKIESVWGWLKSHHRRHCTYNYAKRKADLPKTMLQLLPISTVRKYSRSFFRFMSGYRLGVEGPLLDYAMKKYSGHRRIPAGVIAEVEANFLRQKELKKRQV